MRITAAYSLGDIGPAAMEAIPALTKALKDEEKLVREAVSRVPAMSQATKDALARGSKEMLKAIEKIKAEPQ